MTSMMRATGAIIRMLVLNLSLMLHPCVWVATIVVSLMNDKLSPKYVPPTTSPIISGVLMSDWCAMPTAKGVSAAMVPLLVPMLREMKHDARQDGFFGQDAKCEIDSGIHCS